MEFGEADDRVHVNALFSLQDTQLLRGKAVLTWGLTNPPKKGWKRYLQVA
jgi:hypothetical protein